MSRIRFRKIIAGVWLSLPQSEAPASRSGPPEVDSGDNWLGSGQSQQITIASRETYLAEIGTWSSHPKHAAARLRAVQYAAIGTAGVLVALFALVWFVSIRPSDVVTLILEFPEWMDRQANKVILLACIIGATLTAVLTASIQIRGSLITTFAQRPRRSQALEVVSVILLLAMAAGLPFLVARIDDFWIRLAAHLLALAPLPFLIAFLEFAAATPKGSEPAFRPVRFATTAVVVLLIVSPFMVFQFAADALNTDIAGWVATILPVDAMTRAIEGGQVGSGAPEWLKGIAQGKYGPEAKSLLDMALIAVRTGQEPTQYLLDSVQTALAPWIAQIIRLVSLIVLLPASAAAVGLAVFYANAIRDSVERTEANGTTSQASQQSKRTGCLGLVLNLITAPFRWMLQQSSEENKTAESTTEVINQFIEVLREEGAAAKLEGVAAVEQPVQTSESVAPLFGQAWADPMFDGQRPSVDQVNALETFVNRYIAHLEESEAEGFGGDAHTHPDFFFESSPGCGTTSTLLALAFYAATVRGQKVLLLVGDKHRQKAAITRCQRMLKRVRMHELVTVGSFSEEDVGDWYRNFPRVVAGQIGADSGYRGVPEIIVSTIEEWERVTQSPAFNRSDELLRSVILDTEVVLVDDFARGPNSAVQSLHLPFVLDKHRLILQGQLRSMQLVVGAPVLDTGTRELLSRRLFGGNGLAHSVSLRRPRAQAIKTIDVVAESGRATDALRTCVQKCLEKGFSVVVLRQGADLAQAAELAESLTGPHGTPQVVGQVDELPTATQQRVQAVLYRQAIGGDPGYAIAARIQDSDGLVIQVREAGVASFEVDPNPIPVLASPRARAPFFAHLRSACRFIQPMSPIHRNEWARFGLRERGNTQPLECGVGESFRRDPLLPSLIIDPPEPNDLSDPTTIAFDQAGIWPFVSIRSIEGLLASNPVSVNKPLEDSARLHLTTTRSGFSLGESDRKPDRRRFAKWISSRDEELGETDLAHMSLMLFRQGDAVLRPERIDAALNSRESRHRIRGVAYHEELLERVVPVIEVSFEVEPTSAVIGPEQIAHPSVEWYRFDGGRKPMVCRTSIVKVADLQGNQAALGHRAEFETDCVISVLTIGMAMPERDRAEWIRAMFAGAWTTAPNSGGSRVARVMWPSLTACLQVAIQRLLPDLKTFARCIAFRPPAGGSGACVFFVEPSGTAGTAVETMRSVLDRESLRVRFLEALEEGISKIEAADAQSRVMASPLYEGEILTSDVAELRELLASLSNATPNARWQPTREVGVIRSPGPSNDCSWILPRRVVPVGQVKSSDVVHVRTGETYEWDDRHRVPILEWRGDRCVCSDGDQPIRYRVVLDSFVDHARLDVESFGFSSEEVNRCLAADGHAAGEYLRQRGFQFRGGVVATDYEWMIERSVASVTPLATDIIGRADEAGANSMRGRLEAIISFVCSLREERPQELVDGKSRLGMRMPSDTLCRRAGDGNARVLVAASLIRAAKLAECKIVLAKDQLLLGIRIERAAEDDWVDYPSGRFVLVDCAEALAAIGRIGRVRRELIGAATQLISAR